MAVSRKNVFDVKSTLTIDGISYIHYSLARLAAQGWSQISRFPASMKILLENLLRNGDSGISSPHDVETLLAYPSLERVANVDLPFMPSRVILQDFTGVPVVVDFAAMRDAVKGLGGNPDLINPMIHADLVIDHSIQVDFYGSSDSLGANEEKEYERNRERYAFLRWAQNAFQNFTVVPPGRGIVHQVNLEFLASVVNVGESGSQRIAHPDTVLGTDSHTTMINGLGVVGWGVGGIEAEAVMLGQPYHLPVPEVIGVKLVGELRPGVTATDLVLQVTETLRKRQVVGRFVEFYGAGLASLKLPDRATIANMAPEYGATVGLFPIDDETLNYLRLTGRSEHLIRLVEAYAKEQGLFHFKDGDTPLFTDILELDLSEVQPNLAGPKRPQHRIPLREAGKAFRNALGKPQAEWGFGLEEADKSKSIDTTIDDNAFELSHGSVVIAAITSCTNTSNPAVMMAAGLLAKKALDRGIRSKPWVKTSLAPGSRVVTDYLAKAGLLNPLQAQGFHLVGYGCTTCIGNSGPLPEGVSKAVEAGNLVVAAVLSGNRNFEGRIHGAVRANYLASPPLVVAYALAGRMTFDFETEPLGVDAHGTPTFLRDIWPSNDEISIAMEENIRASFFVESYRGIYTGDALWEDLFVPKGGIYPWDEFSTYIRRPPFLEALTLHSPLPPDIKGARALLYLGDSVTTDHISPAGAIPPQSPAGRYLESIGVAPGDFNSYGSRRGNHEVMMRGTFANTRLRNRLVEGVAGGYTRHLPSNRQMTVWEASRMYLEEQVPLIVLAGKEYGTGSSRDWAAKGTSLLGIKAVIAESYERIHRSNLIGMGVFPLQFAQGTSAASLGLTGDETFHFRNFGEELKPGQTITVEAIPPQGARKVFEALSRLNSPIEVENYLNGGILPKVLRELLKDHS